MIESNRLAPLRIFHGDAPEDLAVTFLASTDLPLRDRTLLVHDADMTSRLAKHHRSQITLDVHAAETIGGELFRASVLRRQDTGTPVEFGAIRISLDAFPPEPRRWILEGQVPFGAILQHFTIPFTSHPRGYFRIAIDARLSGLLGGVPGQLLFGRCNELRHASGGLLAEVVEILPSE